MKRSMKTNFRRLLSLAGAVCAISATSVQAGDLAVDNLTVATNLTVQGAVSGNTFYGNGSGLTNLAGLPIIFQFNTTGSGVTNTPLHLQFIDVKDLFHGFSHGSWLISFVARQNDQGTLINELWYFSVTPLWNGTWNYEMKRIAGQKSHQIICRQLSLTTTNLLLDWQIGSQAQDDSSIGVVVYSLNKGAADKLFGQWAVVFDSQYQTNASSAQLVDADFTYASTLRLAASSVDLTNVVTGAANNGQIATKGYVDTALVGALNGNGGGLTNLNASQIASGTVPLARLGIIDPAHGGLGLNASAWSANRLPYTTATGTFGSAPVNAYGLLLLNAATPSAATSLLGLPSNLATFNTNDVVITFTPTNGVGWYRLTVSWASESISGNLTITRVENYPTNSIMDLEFQYYAVGYNTSPGSVGNINLLRSYSRYPTLGISALRVGNKSYDTNSAPVVYLDVYVDNALGAPFVLRTHGGTHLEHLLLSPVYMGVTNMPLATKSLTINRANGFQTTGAFIAGTNNIVVTDPAGLVLSSALNLVKPAQGGLGLNASGWGAGLIPYTTATGTFGSIAASSFVANNATGVNLTGTFNGNGGGLTALNATQLTTGTVPLARLPASVLINGQAQAVGIGTTPTEQLHVVGNIKATGQFIGSAAGLTVPQQGDLSMGTFTQ